MGLNIYRYKSLQYMGSKRESRKDLNNWQGFCNIEWDKKLDQWSYEIMIAKPPSIRSYSIPKMEVAMVKLV